MANNKPMSKPVLYGIFIIKFFFGLGLIVWTVMMTLSSDVGKDNDNAFLGNYHTVDANYNNMVIDNLKIEKKYDIKLMLNDKIIDGLPYKDVFLAQRAIIKRKTGKNILKLGKNIFEVKILTKDGQVVKNTKTNMLITMATNHIFDIKLDFNSSNTHEFEVKQMGFYNITGTIEIDDLKGSFFIKTNAK